MAWHHDQNTHFPFYMDFLSCSFVSFSYTSGQKPHIPGKSDELKCFVFELSHNFQLFISSSHPLSVCFLFIITLIWYWMPQFMKC